MSKRAKQKALEEYPFRWTPGSPPTWADERRIEGYINGYDQAEKDTIERACEWLSRHSDIDLIMFRKAMEE